MKELEKVVELKTKVYVANDGKEFASKYECEKYELDLLKEKIRKNITKLRLFGKPKDMMPINTNAFPSEMSTYDWFTVTCKTDLENLNHAFPGIEGSVGLLDIEYPEVVCVEENDCGDAWFYTLSEMRKDTVDFFAKLGIGVSFFDL